MQSKRNQERESEFNAFVKEQESAYALFCQLNNFSELLWDHYESSFLDKLCERKSQPQEPYSEDLPF